jgi:NAD(P)-dependent dehydrogenase (short-subunit alcohol dehydrogenase family)
MTTWFITGAGRGLGWEIARAALHDGHRVVATARTTAGVADSLPDPHGRLLVLPLDVTDRAMIADAVGTAVTEAGRIDVLVNNAGYGLLGTFEEVSPEEIDRQLRTNVTGVFDVTRAVLPIMRAQRSGHIITMSSVSGIIGIAGSSVYSAAKFAVAGWSEALVGELAPFGIRVTSVHPGMFRTDFLDPSSAARTDLVIDDYRDFDAARTAYLASRNHQQEGDPARFAQAVLQLAELDEPPARWAAGRDGLAAFRTRAEQLTTSAAAWEGLSTATVFPE